MIGRPRRVTYRRATLGAVGALLALAVACSSSHEAPDAPALSPPAEAGPVGGGNSGPGDPYGGAGMPAPGGDAPAAASDPTEAAPNPQSEPESPPDELPRLSYFDGVDASEFQLLAGDAAAYDEFGWSADVAGDTIIVGAPLNDDLGREAGAAYIFERSGNAWIESAKLLPDDGEPGLWFGRWVAIDGDTALVSAPLTDVVGADDDAGAVYVFVRVAAGWVQQAKLVASDAGGGDQFGWSVDLSGETAVISAWSDDHGGEDSGSIYIFQRSGGRWEEEAHLIAGDPGIGDVFGVDVGIDGDTVVVGATGDDVGGRDSGAAYVFVRRGGSWSQEAKLLPDGVSKFDEFGRSVAISGDTIIVGAYLDDGAGANAGAAYLFQRRDGVWREQAKVTAAGTAAGDWLGYAVAIDGEVALLGAPHWRHPTLGIIRAGAAYLFERAGERWEEVATLTADDAEQAGEAADFSWLTALADGVAVVGAWFADTAAGIDAGAAYAYVLPEG